MRLTITNYIDVISSWCHWAVPAWQNLRERYGERVDFQWKIALMDASGFPRSRAQMEWFYRRSGMLMRSPRMLSAAWYESARTEYLEPNCVAEAARALGVEDDRVWTALGKAQLCDGQRIGDWEAAAEIAARAAGLEKTELLKCARAPEIEERVRATTAEFHALQVTQRPTFVIDTPIGDRAMFSGFAKAAPIAATLDAMLDDIAGYQSHAAHSASRPPNEQRIFCVDSARLRRNVLPVARCRNTTSPRFGPCREPVGALLANAPMCECGAPVRQVSAIKQPRRQPHSLAPAGR